MTNDVGQDAMMKCGPTYMNEGAWMFKVGCPAKTDHGCALVHARRPLMCRIFPWMAVPVYGPDKEDIEVRLFLAAHECPHWKHFGDNYLQAKEEFDNG